ncbi:glycosyltransferase family 2 protein [Yoonia sp. R2331]|uniref:glycosyltransferase family 2 protein n=1 Tax=Yoonia sp. R2331 TaxID=3237238 RepID=UPI0034E52BD5
MTSFSIIIPCFNAAETILETLCSLQAQTVTNWEAVCVDDGSTDATTRIIAAARDADPRIILTHNTSKGPSAARNHGALTLAKGEIIAFCDADDLWSPSKLAELNAEFSDLFVDAAFGKVAFFRDRPSAVTATSTVPSKPLHIPMLLSENPVCTMSNLSIRRAIFERSGGFDETLVHNEDLEWLVRLVGQGANVVGLPTTQTFYRASPYGLSSDLKAMEVGRKAVLETAASFGFEPDAASNAVYQRYLARRALRLGQGRTLALRFALSGLAICPSGFFASPKRGALTLIGALCAFVLPTPVCRTLFSR